MANTVLTPITSLIWTEVQEGVVGTISNTSEKDVFLLEATSLPAASIKLGYKLRAGLEVSYTLDVGQKVFARSVIPTVTLAVTEE